jgi:hypothetical protein
MARFWNQVLIGKDDECWPWIGTTNGKDRGSFVYRRDDRVIRVKAHRFAYRIAKGKIPKGLLVCHTCDNGLCCNTYRHLFLGTHSDNALDMIRKGRGRQRRAEKSGKAVLSNADVQEIFKLYETGLRKVDIAPIMGVSPQHIGDIINGKDRLYG